MLYRTHFNFYICETLSARGLVSLMKPGKSFVGMATRNFSYYSGRFTKTKVLLIPDLGFHVIITFPGSLAGTT